MSDDLGFYLTPEVLDKYHISDIPMNPMKIIGINSWQIVTYPLFAQLMKMRLEELYEDYAKYSFSFYSGRLNTYAIAVKAGMPINDFEFILAHEIGHIVYSHVNPNKTLNIQMTREEEYLADRFAAYILGIG